MDGATPSLILPETRQDGRRVNANATALGPTPMTETALANVYRAYIACLNRQDWAGLGEFVQHDARHNGRPFGLGGYRAML